MLSCCLGHDLPPKLIWKLPGYPDLVQCPRCRLVFLRSIPESFEQGRGLDEQYFSYYAAHPEDKLRFSRKLLRKIERFRRPPGALLDVGASVGYLLAAAQEHGWRIDGIERSPQATAYAQERFGISVRADRIETANLERGAYDVIVLYHVLEHLPDPGSVIDRLTLALRPNGLIIVGVPNWDGMMRRMLRRRWPLLVPGSHLWHFTANTLTAFLAHHELTMAHIESETGFVRPALGFHPSPKMIWNEMIKSFYFFHWFGWGETLFAVAKRAPSRNIH